MYTNPRPVVFELKKSPYVKIEGVRGSRGCGQNNNSHVVITSHRIYAIDLEKSYLKKNN